VGQPVERPAAEDQRAFLQGQPARASQYESEAAQAENAGDRTAACNAYRRAANAWRDAADAGTSLIIETLNDSSLDADAVNENVHIMANNAEVDDQSAAKVCN
jgi:hypothetical protein